MYIYIYNYILEPTRTAYKNKAQYGQLSGYKLNEADNCLKSLLKGIGDSDIFMIADNVLFAVQPSAEEKGMRHVIYNP